MNRRLKVLAIYGVYAAIVFAVYGLNAKALMLDAFPSAIFAVTAWAGVLAFMNDRYYWNWGNAPAGQLDERQVQSRLNAYFVAYSMFVTLVFVGLVALAFGSDLLKIETWSVADASAVIWAVFLTGMTLPSAILMWTDRASDAGEE
jgi:hypothetical protein